jgi:acyl-CoA synthetase (AMP-forming)/AMP-acid ligase II
MIKGLGLFVNIELVKIRGIVKSDMFTHIGEILARNARMFPDDVSLIERTPAEKERTEITWKEFDDRANKFAQALTEKGIKKGHRVVHCMMNSIDWLVIYFGIVRTGAWVVPLNFRFTAEEVKYCCDVAEPQAVVFDGEFKDRITAIQNELPSVQTYICVDNKTPDYAESYAGLVKGVPDTPLDVEIDSQDECGLYFTSGTTGTPKPILLTHGNMLSACITEKVHHCQTKDDCFILIPPLYHTGSKMHWFGSLIVGGKAVILKGVSPEWTLEAISEEGGTIVWLLVPWAQDILLKFDSGELKPGDYKLNQCRLMHIGAQPVPASIVRRWKSYFPTMDYDTNYGLSESTGPGCVHLGIGNEHKIGAIGIPGFNWECKIVDEKGVLVNKGEAGELCVRGNGVMKEYYKNAEATKKALVDGWLYTGDIAKADKEGFIWLVDRKKDVIITGGENIFPVEIEDFLHSHPGIKDVAAIGLADERLGEVVAVVAELKPGVTLTETEIIKFCDPLPRYKRPRKVLFGEIPRNPTGKIEKPKLREKYSEKSGTISGLVTS